MDIPTWIGQAGGPTSAALVVAYVAREYIRYRRQIRLTEMLFEKVTDPRDAIDGLTTIVTSDNGAPSPRKRLPRRGAPREPSG